MEIGQTIIMQFDCFGVTSFEDKKVVAFDDDTVSVNEYFDVYDESADENIEIARKFSRQTGKCLNEKSPFGGKRSITPQ